MKIHFFRKKVLFPALFVFGVATMFDLSVKKAETGYAVETDFEIDDSGELTGYHGEENEVTVPEGVKAIGEYAFFKCESLKKIILPDSVKEVKKAAFSECSNLTEVVFSDNVETIEKYAFSECSSLAEIVIPEKVTKILGNTFYKCSGLKEIKLPKGLKSIGTSAFLGCGLKEITIPKNVKKIKVNAFKKSSIEKFPVLKNMETVYCRYGKFFGCEEADELKIKLTAGKKLKIKSDRHMKKSLKIKSQKKKIVSVDERTITAEKKGKADIVLSWYSRHGKYREKALNIIVK